MPNILSSAHNKPFAPGFPVHIVHLHIPSLWSPQGEMERSPAGELAPDVLVIPQPPYQ